MRLPTIAILSLLSSSLLTIPTVIASNEGFIASAPPLLTLENGSSVYNMPASGGVIQIKFSTASTTTTTTNTATFAAEGIDNMVIHGDGTMDPDNLNSSDGAIGVEVEIDLEKLTDLTKDAIDIDLGEGVGPLTFIREDIASSSLHSDGQRKRRKLRRIQEIRMDSIHDLIDTNDDGYHTDYLPPNPIFSDASPSQKFTYFEGKASFQNTEASMYIKSMTHPTLTHPDTGEAVQFLNGIIVTHRYDYVFRGDPVTGKTYLTQMDPELYPGMPDPIDPLMDDSFDEGERRSLREEREFVERELEEVERRRRRMEEDNNNEEIGEIVDLGGGIRGRVNRRTQSDDGSVLDIIIVYTLNALCQANNQAYPCDDIAPAQHMNIISKAEGSIVYTNKAYIDSGIETQLRLVQVIYTAGINDSSYECKSILYALQGTADGVMDEVHDKRSEWGADFVALLTSSKVSGCGGIAFLGPYKSVMFSVTLQSYLPAVMAHEVGHNYGCEHDRLNADPGKPYQYGWQDPEGTFRTIMAYDCPRRSCGRIQYFSNQIARHNGKIMGDANNNCARRHNDVRKIIANYYKVRVTNAPTVSHAPSISAAPSSSPSALPSSAPTGSPKPSSTPSMSVEPTSMPSEYPTFSIADLDAFDKLTSPGSTDMQVQHGIMFDIEAKNVDITIHNFRIPFYFAGNVTISIWSKEGSFWYEKNNPGAWDLLGSPEAYSPGITLLNPVPLPIRGGNEYGFDPIYIPAGTRKGIFITVNETSPEDNLIGMDRKSGSTCESQAFLPWQFPVWFENDDMAIHEGIYKEGWSSSFGTAGSGSDSFRYVGTVLYTSTKSSAPSLSSGPSVSQLPSLSPSLSLAPSSSPSSSQSPSASLEPSLGPSLSLSPSSLPSNLPSTSREPSLGPSLSLAPSVSHVPSLSLVPTAYPDISSGPAIKFSTPEGIMIEVSSRKENILINNMKLSIFSVSPEYAGNTVELIVYTVQGSFYNETSGDSVDQAAWVERGRVQVYAGFTTTPAFLPENSFTPFLVEKGKTVGIYVTIADPIKNHRIFATIGTTIKGNDFQNDDLVVRQGIAKQWNLCQSWGDSLTDTNGTPYPYSFYGSLVYTRAGTNNPTDVPSLLPSSPPSLSVAPSVSSVPSLTPTVSKFPSLNPSNPPSTSVVPSGNPSTTPNPTYERQTLTTRTANYGNSGYGIMFDIIASTPVQFHSIFLSQMQNYPMNIKVYTRSGTHYYAYDDMAQWEEIQSYTNFTAGKNGGKLSFPPQFTGVDQTRAFYIAIIETYGEIWPLLGGLLPGTNYRDGVWANDTAISLMEGIKFYGISEDKPFGIGTPESGPFMHSGPGGTSFNMKDGQIEYSLAKTIMPSVAPSQSSAPTLSLRPSLGPTLSSEPSSSPSLSSVPSLSPSSMPSVSAVPSLSPSESPSANPSVSAMPSFVPSISSMPSSSPSKAPSSTPSSEPSMAPSVSSMPSSLPSSTPSLAPSVSSAPSSSPTVSLMPSQDRVFLSSYTSGLRSGAFGVMFEVTPKRAILVQTFAIKHFGGNNFNFRVFTKSGPIGSSYNTANAWTEIGSISYASLSSSGSSNPITLPSQGIDAVPIYTGETQSFYIACVGNYFEVREETLGTKSENNEVSIVAGLKKPENGLFHTNTQGTQSTKYMFQGKLIYSYEVDPPSASPSATPSSLPSTSSMPTVKTPFPSSEPSKSLAPTGTPITPTGAPSVSDKPTIDPFSEVHIEITVPSRMTISGFNIPTNQVEINTVITILAATLKKAASANLNTSQRIIDVKIISIGGVKVTSTQRLRSLTGGTLIEYEILLEAICATSSCDDSQEVANALYKQATDSMKAAIDDGSLATTLKQNAQAAGNADSLLTVAVDSGDFSPVIITILGLLTDFYPDWVGGGYCSNDGNEPFYMQKDARTWLYPTRAGCCDRYFSYTYNECMGSLAASSGKYYPDWTNGGDACLVDGKEPSYMKSNPDGWLYDDADSCCKRYFPWNFSKCVTSSGGTVSNLATREWYVDHAKKQCVQDCAVDATDPTCGGNANAWDSLHGTVSECCTKHLGWIKTSTCAAVSQGQTPPDSNKWYVEWSNESCVKDCEGNAPCGGLAQPWNGLFDSVVECCKTMPWNDKCGQ